jgi:hypothetical protein
MPPLFRLVSDTTEGSALSGVFHEKSWKARQGIRRLWIGSDREVCR